jgi:hypothetical protein
MSRKPTLEEALEARAIYATAGARWPNSAEALERYRHTVSWARLYWPRRHRYNPDYAAFLIEQVARAALMARYVRIVGSKGHLSCA